MELKEFLARQLNDHQESQRGVRQPTYFTWHENHIMQAVEMGVSFVVGLVPQHFSETRTLITTRESCVVSFCEACKEFLGLISVSINGNDCIDLVEKDEGDEYKENSLLSMMQSVCFQDEESEESDKIESLEYTRVDSSKCLIRFGEAIPAGTELKYSCLNRPSVQEFIENDNNKDYLPIVAEYAMYWLYRTDSESKTNLVRAQEHRQMIGFLVQTKLLIEFSMVEDDYTYGNRKVGKSKRVSREV